MRRRTMPAALHVELVPLLSRAVVVDSLMLEGATLRLVRTDSGIQFPSAEDEEAPAGTNPDGDLLNGVPVKSPLAWAFAYRFPVHRISPDFLPTEPESEPVYLALYRGSDDSVGFLELNAVFQILARLVHEHAAVACPPE